MIGTKWIAVTGIMVLLTTVMPAFGQNEDNLREYFEGRLVVILVDMPADEDGINVQADKGRSIDRRDINEDIQRYGAAFREGDLAKITLIKKKGKHIEFQLNGGGWQGRRSASLRYTKEPKSERHKDIEAELALLPNPSDNKVPNEEKQLRLRQILEEDLEELIHHYNTINAKRLTEAREIQASAQQDINHSILAAGSRFNLRFDRNVPPNALTPEGLMAVLEKYVDFSQEAVDTAYKRQQQQTDEVVQEQAEAVRPRESEYEPASNYEILKNLRKGLLWEDALKLLGSPSRDDVYTEGRLRVKVCTFDQTALGIIEAEFVEEVLVYYIISSR